MSIICLPIDVFQHFDISMEDVENLGLDMAIYLAHSDIEKYQETLLKFPDIKPTKEYENYLFNKGNRKHNILSYLCAIHFGLVNKENKKFSLCFDYGYDDDIDYLYHYCGKLLKYFDIYIDSINDVYDYFMFRAKDEDTKDYIKNNWKHVIPYNIEFKKVCTIVNGNDCLEVLVNYNTKEQIEFIEHKDYF